MTTRPYKRTGNGRFTQGTGPGPGRPKLPKGYLELEPLAIAKQREALESGGLGAGQLQTAENVLSRIHGKAPQGLEISGSDGGPVKTEIVVRYVGHDD